MFLQKLHLFPSLCLMFPPAIHYLLPIIVCIVVALGFITVATRARATETGVCPLYAAAAVCKAERGNIQKIASLGALGCQTSLGDWQMRSRLSAKPHQASTSTQPAQRPKLSAERHVVVDQQKQKHCVPWYMIHGTWCTAMYKQDVLFVGRKILTRRKLQCR